MSSFSIPSDINSWDRLKTAEYYHQVLGWAVHALYPPNRGQEAERGKKPLAKGWRGHIAAEIAPDYLREHFGSGFNNLGVVVRGPFVHVDLDSKPDAGASVRAWLAEQPQLTAVPRERTGGGAHLAFVCRDLPATIKSAGKALTSQINEAVTAELYSDGTNIVVSPSVHKSGTQYTWEVTGPIPEVTWNQLKAWFGFAEPEEKRRGRPSKDRPWWSRFKGALHTLDAVELFRAAGLLGECLDPDEGKWSVACPWQHEHTGGKPAGSAPGTDTVIFQKDGADSPPGFRCLHAHCAERSMQHVLEHLDDQTPGLVDRHCREMRVWEEGRITSDGRPCVELPNMDRPDSVFADEMGKHIGERRGWFNKSGTVVSVGTRRFSETISSLSFQSVQPIEACTAAEQFVQPGILREDKDSGDLVFLANSMTRECASKLISSPQFRAKLPEIVRILDVPIPVRLPGGGIVFPEEGYDPRFQSYLDPDGPRVRPMPFDRALELLWEVHKDFGWKNQQSLIHAYARLLTPFCRGLMGWEARLPLWHYCANRPRAGKDYLAGITQLIYEGRTCEDAPLERESEETRKRITAALMAGRRSMHFANCQGHIQDAAFIGAITSKTFAVRNLGSTDAKSDMTLPNEMEFSLSANVGLTFREDIEPRTRRISLAFFEENPNGRIFANPVLHRWVLAHRSELLSAVGALVKRWMDEGCPPGPTPYNSFQEWSQVVGGIMHACGLGNPCLPHEEDGGVGGDLLEKAMRALYRLGHENYPDVWVEKGDVFKLVANADDEGLLFFGSFTGETGAHEAKKRIGRYMSQYKGRELGGIFLEIDGKRKGERQQVRFYRNDSTGSPEQLSLTPILGSKGKNGNSDFCESSEKINSGENNKNNILKEYIYRAKAEYSPLSTASTLTLTSDRGRFPEIIAAIESAGVVALDLETFGDRKTDGLNPWRGDIRLLSLKVAGREPWLIDLQATGYQLGVLGTALESVLVVAHNAKFDLLWLAVKCGVRPTRVFCTLTAARILTAGIKPGNNLDQCLQRYLGLAPASDHSKSDWGGLFLTDDQLAYAARDVSHLHELRAVQEKEMTAVKLDTVCALEMELCPVVVGMEEAGIAMDVPRLRGLRDSSREIVRRGTDELRRLLKVPTLNPGSPDQLKAALGRAGINVANTNEETLTASDDTRIVPVILKLRSAEKTAQQAESLLESVESDGRIHGRFEPLGTDTGRFTSKTPNLQNVARGPLRECFLAPEGSRLVVADYSQIELRAAAAIAGETKMIEAYRSGQDLHRGTAAVVLDKDVTEVTKEDRQLAKAVNFGLLYGQSARGLVRYAATAYGVTLLEDDAYAIRQAFFRTYGHLRQWHGQSHVTAEKGITEVRTVLDRRRLIPAEADAWNRFTALVNTPVQGGSAEGMKRAMILLAKRLPTGARIISTVHDELIVEAPMTEAETVRRLVQTAMVEAMSDLFPQVPIEAEAGVCERWSEK